MEYRPADFTYWDTVEYFTLTEAAWLWCDLEPPARGFEFMPVLGKGIKPHPLISNLPAKVIAPQGLCGKMPPKAKPLIV